MEKGNNWEPRVGQKVVALISASNFKRGRKYTVAAVKQCRCGTFHVYAQNLPKPGVNNTACLDCNGNFISHDYQSMRSFRFAPVVEQYNSDAIKEILEKYQPCEGGSVDVPVKEVKEAKV